MNSIDASRTSLFAGRDLRAAWTRALTVLLLGLLWGAPLPLHAQAPATGRISIAGVEDQNFPSVSLFLDMVDANGTPVSGLTAAAFTLQEDGQPALIGALTADPSAPLALLLTLDRSTDVNTWAAVQGAVAATIDALEEEDQVAITTIAEQVQAVQGFTNNQESARNALAGVTPGGQFSAINPALIDAVGRFNDELPPRRAIVLVADAADNISGVTTADTIAQLAGQGIPVYIVGFGDRVQASADFAQIAAATGGGFFPVASANELQATLLSLLQTLRLGYRLDFVSSIQADNQPHAAQVQVNAPTVQGVATADFVARPSTLTVTLPSLVSGQPVAGVINLTAAVTASGPIASVEFRVDDQPIGTTPDPALPVVWDTSSLSPGPHTLSVVVTDVVGNRGEAAVEIRIAAAAPRLDLIGVDSGDFPRVTTFVDAFGANGLPLVGLSGQSFVVSEDNQIVNPAQVTAQVDATQPVHLILVLDTGVTAADWAQVRNAANSMIDGLRPQDQLAIYTFAAVPTLLQGATSDRNQLKAALATVQPTPPTPEANDNGLNQALLDAVNFASTLPTGRRAIVVVTNGLDNSGQIALNDALNVIEAQTTPIHLIGFATDALTAGTLAGIAQVGRGNSVTVNAAADVRSALQTLLLLLQQGYRIGFTSGLQADDLSHSLTVSLAGVGIDAEARSDFIARSRPITLTIPNVTAGSTVAGPVNLTAQAEAAAPLVAVEYRLNGDLLASVADTTFSVIWNSDTVSPGEYTLEVIATDAAGNTGATSVAFTVVAPIAVTAALAPENSDGDIVVGDRVTVEADVQLFSGEARVEFYADRLLLGSDNRAPFQIEFDSGEFAPGNHTVTVVARDDAGREAVSTVDFVLVAPPEPTPAATTVAGAVGGVAIPGMPGALRGINWGQFLTWTGIGLVVLLALLAAMAAIGALRRNAAEQKLTPMRITLTNQGNAPTAYLLRGDDPQGALTFQFSLNGTRLGLPPVARFGGEESASAGNGARPPTLPTIPGLPANVPVPTGQDLDKWMDTAVELRGISVIIVSILQSISYLLPPALSRPIRNLNMQIRRGQMMVRRAETVQRQVGRLNQSEMGQKVVQSTGEAAQGVGEFATAESTRGAVAGATTAAYGGATRAVNSLYDLTGGTKPTGAGAAAGGAGARQWVYVPMVNPGDALNIDVMVGMKSGRGGEHQPFRILSRAVGDENTQPVVEEGSIRLERKSNTPVLMSVAAVFLVLVVAAGSLWWLVGRLF